jgi:hypothetical protein
LTESADALADTFQEEIRAKRLSDRISATVRARAMIDLMQGVMLRAKAGVPREQLLSDAHGYVQLLLS